MTAKIAFQETEREARLTVAKQAGVEYLAWVTHEANTCPFCAYMSGKVIRADDPIADTLIPAHINCECMWAAVGLREKGKLDHLDQEDPEFIRLRDEHAHFARDPEKFEVLRLPAAPSGRDLTFRRPGKDKPAKVTWHHARYDLPGLDESTIQEGVETVGERFVPVDLPAPPAATAAETAALQARAEGIVAPLRRRVEKVAAARGKMTGAREELQAKLDALAEGRNLTPGPSPSTERGGRAPTRAMRELQARVEKLDAQIGRLAQEEDTLSRAVEHTLRAEGGADVAPAAPIAPSAEGGGGEAPQPRGSARRAEQQARRMGVEKVSYAERPEAGERVNFVLRELHQAGLPLPQEVVIDAEEARQRIEADPRAEPFILQFSGTAERGRLLINPAARYWSDPRGVAAGERRLGYWSTGDPNHPIYHDLAHWLHCQRDPAAYQASLGAELPAERIVEVADQVSGRAAENQREFIAEVFVRLWRGESADPGMMELYRSLGGIEP